MLGEPDIVVRSQRDPHRVRASRQRENRYGAAEGDASDEICKGIGEPKISVRAFGDLVGEDATGNWK